MFGGKLPTFGLYQDNPKEVNAVDSVLLDYHLFNWLMLQVPDDQCRYAAGVILPTEPSAETAELLKSKDLSQHTFPNIDKAFMTDFPVTSFLSLYLMIWKVYHNMENHLKHKVSPNRNREVSHNVILLFCWMTSWNGSLLAWSLLFSHAMTLIAFTSLSFSPSEF